jgi:hypothetical protein
MLFIAVSLWIGRLSWFPCSRLSWSQPFLGSAGKHLNVTSSNLHWIICPAPPLLQFFTVSFLVQSGVQRWRATLGNISDLLSYDGWDYNRRILDTCMFLYLFHLISSFVEHHSSDGRTQKITGTLGVSNSILLDLSVYWMTEVSSILNAWSEGSSSYPSEESAILRTGGIYCVCQLQIRI